MFGLFGGFGWGWQWGKRYDLRNLRLFVSEINEKATIEGLRKGLKIGNGVGDRAVLVSHRKPFVKPQIFVHVKGWH